MKVDEGIDGDGGTMQHNLALETIIAPLLSGSPTHYPEPGKVLDNVVF